MGVDEFLRWMAYTTIEPLESERADWRAALIMSQQYNMNRKKGTPAKSPKQFLPQFKQPRRASTLDQMELALWAQYIAMGGQIPEGTAH
jgi:hypothetical protein